MFEAKNFFIKRKIIPLLPYHSIPASVVILIFILALSFSCKNDSSSSGTFSLTLSDRSATQIWLHISTPNGSSDPSVLIRNDRTIKSFLNLPRDTIVLDNDLQINTTYVYSIAPLITPISDIATTVRFTTLDTTEHNMVWYVDTLGGGYLRKVRIYNDTLIYAVGDVFTQDSVTLLDTVPWNLAIWNGHRWKLLSVLVQIQTQPPLPPGYCKCELDDVLIFSPNDVILTAGNDVIHWDGTTADNYSYAPGSLTSVWANTEANLYGAGYGGSISHYNGLNWKQLSSGTTTDISDIWGATNADKSVTVLCTVSNLKGNGDKKLIFIDSRDSIHNVNWTSGRVSSTWFHTKNNIYIGGDGVFVGDITYGWSEIQNLPIDYSERVRGTDNNDVFVVGDFGLCLHYNGSTWHNYPELNLQGVVLLDVDVTHTSCVIEGETSGGKVIVIRGYRI